MKRPLKPEKPNKLQGMADDLHLRQSNVLPPDLIANDRYVDDVLWNGPNSRSPMQWAGSFVIGLMLLTFSLATSSIFYEKGARLLLLPFAAIGMFGLRVLYMSLRKRHVRRML